MQENLGEMIDDLVIKREEIRNLENKVNDLKKQKSTMEWKAIQLMDELGLPKASGELGSVSRSQRTNYSIVDPEKLWEFSKKNGIFPYQLRASSKYVSEYEKLEGDLPPGLEPYVSEILNLRAIK